MPSVPAKNGAFDLAPAQGQGQLQAEARELAARFADQARQIRHHLLERSEMHPALWDAFCERGWAGLVLGP